MRIKILSSAVDDLHAGRLFYELQGEGLGEFFFDSLFSDIDALALYAGIPRKFSAITGFCRNASLLPSTTRSMRTLLSSGESLISGAIRTESEEHSSGGEPAPERYGVPPSVRRAVPVALLGWRSRNKGSNKKPGTVPGSRPA